MTQLPPASTSPELGLACTTVPSVMWGAGDTPRASCMLEKNSTNPATPPIPTVFTGQMQDDL